MEIRVMMTVLADSVTKLSRARVHEESDPIRAATILDNVCDDLRVIKQECIRASEELRRQANVE